MADSLGCIILFYNDTLQIGHFNATTLFRFG